MDFLDLDLQPPRAGASPLDERELDLIFRSILGKIKSATEEEVLRFSSMGIRDGLYIIAAINSRRNRLEQRALRVTYNTASGELKIVVMPSRRHETPAAWVIGEFAHWTAAGTLSSEMGDLIDIFPSPTVEGFVGVYAGSTKEPDLAIWPTGLPFPTFVLESGWSETWSDLTADKILWSEGSGYKVNTVILIKMMRPVANRVKVKMEVSTYGQGRHIATMSQCLFPPSINLQHSFTITHQQLLGSALPPGALPGATVEFDIDRLRVKIERSLRADGFEPMT